MAANAMCLLPNGHNGNALITVSFIPFTQFIYD